MNRSNFFSGPSSLQDFLDPSKHAPVPLVEIPEELHGVHMPGLRVFAKMMQMLPLGNVKSVPAFHMLKEAKERGRCSPNTQLVESSSGNTVFSLALLAKAFGLGDVHAFASKEVSKGKLDMLRLAGIHVTLHEEPICPNPDDPKSGIVKARRKGGEPGWLNMDQYQNAANPRGHKDVTAAQILAQLDHQIDLFAAGLGTTGTMVGTATALREARPELRTIGVVRAPNNPVPGVRTQALLSPTGFSYDKTVDYLEAVGTVDAFATSLKMIRSGMLVGPSSGFALAGLRASLLRHRRQWEDHIRQYGRLHAVFICCDLPYPYIDEYMQYLPEVYFPPVQHDMENVTFRSRVKFSPDFEISASEAFRRLYGVTPKEGQQLEAKGVSFSLQDNVEIWDFSDAKRFAEVHVPYALWKTMDDLEIEVASGHPSRTIFVFCPYGGVSLEVVSQLRAKGINAFSISGGMLSWSKADMPRIKSEFCMR